MVQPINYMAMIPQVNLSQSIADFGQALQERQKRIAAQEMKAQYESDLKDVLSNPTQAKFNELIIKYPQQREAFESARKSYGEERVKNEFTQGFEISTALENNNPDVAKQSLLTIIEAKKNSGEPVGIYQQAYDALESGNTTGAQALVNYSLSMLDPDKFKKSSEARVAYGTIASKITTDEAAALKAVADAKVALATASTAEEAAEAKLKLDKANADVAAAKAKYADQVESTNLKKLGADLNLTNANINKVLVETRKLTNEARKAALELEAWKKTGGLDPKTQFDNEEKLRKEYQARTKTYNELQGTYNNIKTSAASKTGPGDIALITGFMKMLDPGSVVRETEFATARDTAGLFDRLANLSQKLQSGQIFSLDSKQREEYVKLAGQYLDAANKKANEEKQSLAVVVKNYNLNPDNVFGTTGAAPIPSPVAPTPAPGAPKTTPAAPNIQSLVEKYRTR